MATRFDNADLEQSKMIFFSTFWLFLKRVPYFLVAAGPGVFKKGLETETYHCIFDIMIFYLKQNMQQIFLVLDILAFGSLLGSDCTK